MSYNPYNPPSKTTTIISDLNLQLNHVIIMIPNKYFAIYNYNGFLNITNTLYITYEAIKDILVSYDMIFLFIILYFFFFSFFFGSRVSIKISWYQSLFVSDYIFTLLSI